MNNETKKEIETRVVSAYMDTIKDKFSPSLPTFEELGKTVKALQKISESIFPDSKFNRQMQANIRLMIDIIENDELDDLDKRNYCNSILSLYPFKK